MKKKRILLVAVALAVLLGGAAYRYSPFVLCYLVNPKIDVEGVQLMMAEEDAKRLLSEKTKDIQGFGGYELFDEIKGIRLTFLNDRDTDFYQKVCRIQIADAKYEILNVRVGDNYENALLTIRKQGFTKEKKGYLGYWKMNLFVILEKNETDEVKSITIGMEDRVSSGRVY